MKKEMIVGLLLMLVMSSFGSEMKPGWDPGAGSAVLTAEMNDASALLKTADSATTKDIDGP